MLKMLTVDKRSFIANFIYGLVGLVIGLAVLPVLQNAVDEYTGDYATLVKIIILVVVAGLVFIGMKIGFGSMIDSK
mgnify:CR=1 FL=1